MRIVAANWFGSKISGIAKVAAATGIEEASEFLLGESNKIVPHDEGTLEKSGNTDIDRSKPEGSVYYDTPYAARLHEHPEYKFQNGREGKWLEKTIKENTSKVNKHIADAIERALRG